MPYCAAPCTMKVGISAVRFASRMQSRIAPVPTRTSTPGVPPPPPLRDHLLRRGYAPSVVARVVRELLGAGAGE